MLPPHGLLAGVTRWTNERLVIDGPNNSLISCVNLENSKDE